MKKYKAKSVSIILPCAWRDKRLNLPYSKELVRVGEDMSVIDHSFRHILASRVKPRVAVIIGPDKCDIVRYLREKYSDAVEMVFVFQKTITEDIAGALKSAERLLGDKNILLMPNTIIEHGNKKTSLIDEALGALDRQPFVFMYKNETSVTRLKLSGALRVQDQKVIDYEEKPLKHVEKYNAFWVSCGFRKEILGEVISVIGHDRPKNFNFKNVFRKSIMYKSSPIRVAESVDISTWTNLNAYLLKQYLTESGIDPKFHQTRQ